MSRLTITVNSIKLRELWKCNLRITQFREPNTHSLCLSSLLTCFYIFLFQLFLSLLGFPYSLFCGLASFHSRGFRKFGWRWNHFICLFYRESSICLCVRDSHLHLHTKSSVYSRPWPLCHPCDSPGALLLEWRNLTCAQMLRCIVDISINISMVRHFYHLHNVTCPVPFVIWKWMTLT